MELNDQLDPLVS